METIKINYLMRNNQWQKHEQVFDTINITKKLICPSGHRNNIILIHNQTKIPIYGNLIQGSISNTYSIKTRNNDSSCLNFEGNSIALDYCDTSKSSQSFSIKLSGSARNEYILQHNDTQNILSYADGVFTLINQNSVDNTNQLFTMQ